MNNVHHEATILSDPVSMKSHTAIISRVGCRPSFHFDNMQFQMTGQRES